MKAFEVNNAVLNELQGYSMSFPMCMSYPSAQHFVQMCSSHDGQPNLESLHNFFLAFAFNSFISSSSLAPSFL